MSESESRPSRSLFKLTGVRKRIADRMLASLHENAPTTVVRETDISALVGLRERLGNQLGQRPSTTALLVRAVASTLRQHELLTAAVLPEGDVVVPSEIAIGVAVETNDGLIVVPAVRQADRKPLAALSTELASLVERARTRRLLPDELVGAAFTITNYGVFGADFGTPVINPPQSAILGVGRFQQRPVCLDGRVEPKWMTYMSLTYDHRIIYGGPAARFLEDLELAFSALEAWADDPESAEGENK